MRILLIQNQIMNGYEKHFFRKCDISWLGYLFFSSYFKDQRSSIPLLPTNFITLCIKLTILLFDLGGRRRSKYCKQIIHFTENSQNYNSNTKIQTFMTFELKDDMDKIILTFGFESPILWTIVSLVFVLLPLSTNNDNWTCEKLKLKNMG